MFSLSGNTSRLEVPCLCYCCTVVCSMIHVTIQAWHVQPLREHQSSGSPMPLLLLYCCVLYDPCHNTGVACSASQGTPVPCLAPLLLLYCCMLHVTIQACLVIARLAACSRNVMKSEDLSQYLSWSISNLGSQVHA